MSKVVKYKADPGALPGISRLSSSNLHPVWQGFLRFCQELQFGEIERLKIQDGLPILAEVTKKKVKFTA